MLIAPSIIATPEGLCAALALALVVELELDITVDC